MEEPVKTGGPGGCETCETPEQASSRRTSISAITTVRQRATRVEVGEFNNLINRHTLPNSPGTHLRKPLAPERFPLLAEINDIEEADSGFPMRWTRESRQSHTIRA